MIPCDFLHWIFACGANLSPDMSLSNTYCGLMLTTDSTFRIHVSHYVAIGQLSQLQHTYHPTSGSWLLVHQHFSYSFNKVWTYIYVYWTFKNTNDILFLIHCNNFNHLLIYFPIYIYIFMSKHCMEQVEQLWFSYSCLQCQSTNSNNK